MRTSVTELQDNPSKYLHHCQHEPVEITNRGKTVGYMVSPTVAQNFVSTKSIYTVNSMAIGQKEDNEKDHSHE